jgi:hypothetical protein
MTTLSHPHIPRGWGHEPKGLPGFRTSISTRSLCEHFEDLCPRIHGPLQELAWLSWAVTD